MDAAATADAEVCYCGPVEEQPCPKCGKPMSYVFGDRCEPCFLKPDWHTDGGVGTGTIGKANYQ